MAIFDYAQAAPCRVSQLSREHQRIASFFQPALARAAAEYTPLEVLRIMTAAVGEAFATTRPKPGTATVLALARGLTAREELKPAEGGSLSTGDTAALLGMTRAAVLKHYQKGQLLGWRQGKQNAMRFPVWQFQEDRVLPGLDRVLRTFQEAAWMDDWAKIGFFLRPLASLQGKRPLDFLRAGDVSRVTAHAEALLE
ncbi:MAG: hypothetical protein JWM59_4520 [Verrucomicrobiales bacterium]|nr:hypothetical protein [Verrucomicrobiales bacterium]